MRALAAGLATLALLIAGCIAPAAPEPGAAPRAIPSLAMEDTEDGSFNSLVCGFTSAERPLEDCNVRATAGNGPANEIDLALDPADPDHMVVVGKGYRYTRTLGSAFLGKVITPYSTTFDGGLTWTEGYLQPLDTQLLEVPILGEEVGITDVSDSDPVVEFAADGTLVAQTLRVSGDGRGLPMFQSLDGGVSFAEVGTAYVGGTDKNWIVTNPFNGEMYSVTLHRVDGTSHTGFVKSTDHGVTWSAPKAICRCVFPGIDVSKDGIIHVIGIGNGAIKYVRSADNGATWTADKVIAPHVSGNTNPCNLRLFRMSSIASIAASRVSPDLYVVWAGKSAASPQLPTGSVCGDFPGYDIFMVQSHDGGATWSAPQRLNDDSGDLTAQFMAQVAVSPNGQDVHVAWMDQRADPLGVLADIYYTHSGDAGTTWNANLRVTERPFLTTLSHHQSAVPQHTGVFVGDYIGLAATDDKAVIAFPDTRYGRADIFVATVV